MARDKRGRRVLVVVLIVVVVGLVVIAASVGLVTRAFRQSNQVDSVPAQTEGRRRGNDPSPTDLMPDIDELVVLTQQEGGPASEDGAEVADPADPPEQVDAPEGEAAPEQEGARPKGLLPKRRHSSDDDGELHDGWDGSVSYSVREERYQRDETADSADYRMPVHYEIDVAYPQLEGAGSYTDSLNEALRECALTFVRDYCDEPSDEAVGIVRDVVNLSQPDDGSQPEAYLSSEVDWAITYNTEDFVSVSFSDSFCIGSFAGEYLHLRCVNANLKTGELYRYDRVLAMNEQIANQFVDTLVANAGEDSDGDGVVSDAECFVVDIIGREAWVQALMGQGDYAHRVMPTFFVDEKGRVNLGVSFWLGSDKGIARGWWDATLTDQQVDEARLDSSLWNVLDE